MDYSQLEPAAVFGYFKDLTQIPHCSYNTKAISDYCVAFAKDHHLDFYQDDTNNVIIVKEASPGYEEAKPVILQGHLDMVCEKTPDSRHDFSCEPLTLAVDGDWLTAVDTTLGGDDGIAVAMVLAVLADDSLAHPKIYGVFTTEEEVGMDGAHVLDVTPLRDAAYMINIDSEDEGIITAGCAGGVRSLLSFPISRERISGLGCTLTVEGLHGGHSGMEISRFGANASVLLGYVLDHLRKHYDFALVDITGGKTDNVIPAKSSATLLIDEADQEGLSECLAAYQAFCRDWYKDNDPGVTLSLLTADVVEAEAFTEACRDKAIFILMQIPNAVQTMSTKIIGLPDTSLNLGSLATTADELKLSLALRSPHQRAKEALGSKLNNFAHYLGGSYEESSPYPGWEYREDSQLRETMIALFQEMYGKTPKVEVIHAGLECGLIYEKLPQLDIVSIGPDLEHVHTPDERLSISSTKRTYEYLVACLAALK